jgi:hypothetical protein
MTDEEKKERPMKKEISRADLLKELLPGLHALFGMHYGMSEPFELTFREYATRSGNIMFEIRCNWFGSSRHTSKAVAMRRYRWILEKWEQGDTHQFNLVCRSSQSRRRRSHDLQECLALVDIIDKSEDAQ